MKRPALPVTLLYASGIVAGKWFDLPLAGLFGISLAVGLFALIWKSQRPCLLCALLVLAGWTNMARHAAIVSPYDLRAILGDSAEDVKLRGVVCATPTARIYERGAKEFWHTTTLVRSSEIFRNNAWQPAFGDVVVGTRGNLDPDIYDGQKVEISGVIRPLSGPLAEGLFDPRQFYENQEIYRQLQTDSSNDWAIAGTAGPLPVSDRFSTWARKTLALGLPVEDEPLRLMWTLALDWKPPLTESVEDPFMRAGTYHIFAVDGLRVGLLAAIGVGLFRALQIPRAGCGLAVIPLIWFYVGLTGWPTSAVRAGIMMTIVIVGWVVKRPGDLINSLFTAAAVILLWNPGQLFQAGFQLSFVVVLCIGVLLPPLRATLHKHLFTTDPFLPDALRPAWRTWMNRLGHWCLDVMAISLVAWLGSIPLAAYYFHLFTPVGVGANFIVVPLTGLALMSCMGSLLTGGWFPGLAVLFNHSSWFWMKCIISVSQWSASWPAGGRYVSAPHSLMFAWYYLALLAVLTGWVFRAKRKYKLAVCIALGGLIPFLI